MTMTSPATPTQSSAVLSEPAVSETGIGATADVYRPQEDTELLIEALAAVDLPGAKVLDLCTGSGAVAIAAALGGADVTAVDSCPRAAGQARRNAVAAGVDIGVVCLDLADVGRSGFDLITCNPPYVPTPLGTELSADGPTHAWNAGPDGRAVLDVVCAVLPGLLADDGTALIVQSALADVESTVDRLRAGGLRAEAILERRIPYGPVLRSRRDRLVQAGFVGADDDEESIVVVRADRVRSERTP